MCANHRFVVPKLLRRARPLTCSGVHTKSQTPTKSIVHERKRAPRKKSACRATVPANARTGQQSIHKFLNTPAAPMHTGGGSEFSQDPLQPCSTAPLRRQPHVLRCTADARGGTLGGPDEYVQNVVAAVAAGQHDIGSTPWVPRPDPHREALAINTARKQAGATPLTSLHLWHLVSRPSVFVWDPAALCPPAGVSCPQCGCAADDGNATGCARQPQAWGRPRAIQTISGHAVCVATKHYCRNCQPLRSNAQVCVRAQGRMRAFSACAPGVIALLPAYARSQWRFTDTGRVLCDRTLVDLVRSLATTTSWSSIANTLTEMRETAWARDVAVPYIRLCTSFGLEPIDLTIVGIHPPGVRAEWVRDLFVSDFQMRQHAVVEELEAEPCGDIISLDWTETVAKRCGARYVFNVFDDNRKVLASATTGTASPYEVEPVLQMLKQRGACPAAAYVDDECCGAWAAVFSRVWLRAAVRLDGMHALKRLTRTTVSPKHPWHRKFCVMLSAAIYTYDEAEAHRLANARIRAGLGEHLPTNVKSKHAPRAVVDPCSVCIRIERVLKAFADTRHNASGELLTQRTARAWACLRTHVLAGCLCDPPDVDMNVFDKHDDIVIAGETFHTFHSRRGTSPLEGFHSHQQKWLGACKHAADAASALMSDGSLRWNRRRPTSVAGSVDKMPLVFAGDVMCDLRSCIGNGSGARAQEHDRMQCGALATPVHIAPSRATGGKRGRIWQSLSDVLPYKIKRLALDLQSNSVSGTVPQRGRLLKRFKIVNNGVSRTTLSPGKRNPKWCRRHTPCVHAPALGMPTNVAEHDPPAESVSTRGASMGGARGSLLKKRKTSRCH